MLDVFPGPRAEALGLKAQAKDPDMIRAMLSSLVRPKQFGALAQKFLLPLASSWSLFLA